MAVRRQTGAAVVCVLLLALAACSSGDDTATAPPGTSDGPVAGAGECDWPMYGHNPSRTFSYPCATDIAPDTVKDLQLAWFFNTEDVVTATPAVIDGNAYVGDWSGRFYAIDTSTGLARWTFQAATEPNVYAGNIVSSAAVTDVDGQQVAIFASGRTLYALETATGTELWHYAVGTADPDDFTEIESSPVVANGKVFVGIDVHNRPDQRAGFVAVDVRTGAEVWYFDLEQGNHHGCGDVWTSPSVDTERGLVFAGGGNCPASPEGWGDYVESLFALDMETGQLRWDYQPHGPNNDDLDFTGAPNLFRANGRDLVGLGNKDGTYYAVDRDSGDLVWKAKATDPGLDEHGSNFSTGGFIGPSAYSNGIVAGGTAVGPPPFVHGINASNGDILWQDSSVQAVYGAAAIANGVLFQGNNDFTFRAYDLASGAELWQHALQGVGAGGSAIVGNDVYTVAGIREPGLEGRSENSGVYKFSIPKPGETFAPSSASTTTTTGARADQHHVGADATTLCQRAVRHVRPGNHASRAAGGLDADPHSPDRHATRSRSRSKAPAWARRISGSNPDRPPPKPVPRHLACSSPRAMTTQPAACCASWTPTTAARPTACRALTTYNRITLLAVESPDSPLPSAQEGVARLIITLSFNPPLTPVGAK